MSDPVQPSVLPGSVPRIGLLACSVFEQEIAFYTRGATHVVDCRFFEMGLHDHPDRLRSILQENIDGLDARTDIDAMVLAYGLCGRGTAGLRPSHHPLVMARAHDCITLFMGSKETYAEHQGRCPSSYYYTPGWNRNRRVPGPEKLEAIRTEWSAKFDPEAVEFLIQCEREQWAAHDTVSYVDLGTEDGIAAAHYARQCAAWLGWRFEQLRGDPTLLRDLLWGNWDEQRFQVVLPGQQLEHAPDETILRSEPVSGRPTTP